MRTFKFGSMSLQDDLDIDIRKDWEEHPQFEKIRRKDKPTKMREYVRRDFTEINRPRPTDMERT